MLANDRSRSGATSEIRIIPTWAWVLAAIAFIGVQFAFNIVMAHEHKGPPPWARPFLGLVVGLLVGCYVLFIGYINRDAKRRGMSPILWTIVAIFIPNALGIILYFLLRQPLQASCPQCGSPVQTGFSFCPRCSYKLNPTCPRCQHAIAPDDVYCPYCGAALHSQTSLSGPPTTLPG